PIPHSVLGQRNQRWPALSRHAATSTMVCAFHCENPPDSGRRVRRDARLVESSGTHCCEDTPRVTASYCLITDGADLWSEATTRRSSVADRKMRIASSAV